MDDSDDIMDHLITCNKLHLHQTWETLFVNGPLKEYIGDKNTPAVNYWLKHKIRCALPPSSIHTNLTVDKFKDLIRIQSEMTRSSPSGQHYDHYKAIFTDNSICLVHATVMTLPFRFGFTPLQL
eukprot:2325463-Ditylum_brightwellii.AAC.1